MKKNTWQKLGDKKFDYWTFNVSDLLNEDLFEFRDSEFKSLNELFGETNKKRSLPKAKALVYDFWKLLMNDMVFSGDCFIFPEIQFGYMKIGDVTEKTNYFNLTKPSYYGGVLFLDERIRKRNKKNYTFRPSSQHRENIMKQYFEKNFRY